MRERRNVIAIVDDDPDMRDALDLLLSSLGYQTESFASAEEFSSVSTASSPTCLLIDIQLGGMSGLEFARNLFLRGRAIPTVFMTGAHDEIVQRQALELGCVAFLHKPFPSDQLIESIARATGANSRIELEARVCLSKATATERV
ncbi:MAG TPA: response regulator [Pseudolabrys sp.]|jgi:FixJ family two-component response regulator